MKKTKLWGGRFSKKTHPLVEEFTKSIHFDKKLAEYDCIGSLYHIFILKKAGLLTQNEFNKLFKGLQEIFDEIKKGHFKIDESFEDIHSYIQHLLEIKKGIGKVAFKLHTCRSRNDQIAFDTKLYCHEKTNVICELLIKLQKTIIQLANENNKIVIPGYTHLQHAIPISLQEYLFAYCKMLNRDTERLFNAKKNINLTLGAGALAGTLIQSANYNIAATKSLPNSIKPTSNSIDAVSDRDFVIEILSALSIIGMHLSRLSEDMILWASKEFDFIDIDDAFCTGSSLMPNKKNPDVLELVRGYSGQLYGNLVSVLVTMKGLPLAYNRDMQLDKEPLFSSFEIIQESLKVLAELFKNISFKRENIARQLDDESLYATDISDYLVKNKVPFKEAHTIVGNLIRHKYKVGKELCEMEDGELQRFHKLLTSKIINVIINPQTSVKSKKSVRKVKRS
ncbi:MAG: argininosuccinate lyase [Omnitrophica WOR_2 bacterium GWA2_47_8]|nr:MAG: argininosuccinate lyase [Omnitrophica WOR_2 bacterium GWA2_47_8]